MISIAVSDLLLHFVVDDVIIAKIQITKRRNETLAYLPLVTRDSRHSCAPDFRFSPLIL